MAQPAPLGLPHAYPAPHGRDRAGAAGSGGTSPAGLAEGVSASGEGDRNRDGDQNGDSDGDRDSPASSSVGAGQRRVVYRDGGAIPPAHSAFRGSSAERKADVTPCFWVQTIGIQKQGAARLREPAAPSSTRPAALLQPRLPWPLTLPGALGGGLALSTGLADITWGVPGWRAQGGWSGPANAWGERPTPAPVGAPGPQLALRHRAGSAGGVSRLPPRRGGGNRRAGGGAAGRPAPTCCGPVSFPAGSAGAGCLLAHPTCRCTPAGSAQEPRESGARGCRQARTCAPLPTPRCMPGSTSKAPPPQAGERGVPGTWDGGSWCWLGGVGTTALTCPFPPPRGVSGRRG